MKYILIAVLTISILLIPGLSHNSFALGIDNHPITYLAAGDCAISQSCSDAQSGANVVNNGSTITIGKIIGTVITIFAWIIGIVSVFMVIFGGFRFVTSSGDPNAVSSARNTIMYALIGLAIATLAQVLVHFVLKSFFPTI